MTPSKVAIVGAGRVGSTLAYTLATRGLAREVVLVDADAARAEGEAADIAHAVPFGAPVDVAAGGLEACAGAAIVVIAAGVSQREGESRTALMARNVDVLRAVLPGALAAAPDAILLMATNPVDALTQAALRLTGLPAGRVLGSGTVLDTARLRAELGARFSVDARNVHAYVLGEHGDSEFVAWSTATLANVPLAEWCAMVGVPCTASDLEAIAARVRDAAYRIIRCKGATWFAIAASLARIVEAILRDQGSVLTVSTRVDGHYGLRDACVSLPAIVDRGGVRRVLPVPLAADEVEALRRSADAVRASLVDAFPPPNP